jgi:hypothetical protein
MNATTRPAGAYDTDPTPYLAFMAIAAGLFLSAPAVLVGLALARAARRAMLTFGVLAIGAATWVYASWGRIELEMHRAQRAGERQGMLMHPSDSFQAAWPHVRTWWLVAAPLASRSHSGSPPFVVGRSKSCASATSAAPSALA